jgi:hypothetical protein
MWWIWPVSGSIDLRWLMICPLAESVWFNALSGIYTHWLPVLKPTRMESTQGNFQDA